MVVSKKVENNIDLFNACVFTKLFVLARRSVYFPVSKLFIIVIIIIIIIIIILLL